MTNKKFRVTVKPVTRYISLGKGVMIHKQRDIELSLADIRLAIIQNAIVTGIVKDKEVTLTLSNYKELDSQPVTIQPTKPKELVRKVVEKPVEQKIEELVEEEVTTEVTEQKTEIIVEENTERPDKDEYKKRHNKK